jgi:hypothetical protein
MNERVMISLEISERRWSAYATSYSNLGEWGNVDSFG